MIRIALFRGINVGGRNTLPMKALSEVLTKCGAREVRTYIQSGNAVFETDAECADRLAGRIRTEIGRRHGFEPEVLLLDAGALADAISGNPFPEATSEPKSLHVGFMATPPARPDLDVPVDREAARWVGAEHPLHRSPGVGEHNEHVICELLGHTEDEYVQLVLDDVLG